VSSRIRAALRRLAQFPRDVRGLSLLEILVALGVLVVALVAIYGLVVNAVRSFGMGEDFLDVQQNARVALDKFAEEARWTTRLVSDTDFFARSPAAPEPPACVGGLCPGSVNLEIPRGNPVIPDCSYFVRFSRDPAGSTFTRLVKPDPNLLTNPNYGTGQCIATVQQDLASLVTGLVLDYCNAAETCTPPYDAVTRAEVVRMTGEITVAKVSAGVQQQRTIGTDVLLRNVGAVAPPIASTPSPTSPPRPTIPRTFAAPTATVTATATVTPTLPGRPPGPLR